jgi:sugar phosphate permease
MLGVAYFLHQADRALFGILTIPIQEDLSISTRQIGWINATLSWTIAIATTIAGILGNKFSKKWTITFSLLSWSLATLCMGFINQITICGIAVSAFAVTMFFRSIAVGVGESFYGPAAMSLLASYHTDTRSTAFSIHQSSLYLGLIMCGAISAALLSILGNWRYVFVSFGASGIVLGIIFIFLLKDKTAENLEQISVTKESPTLMEAFKAFFCNSKVLLATTGFIAIVFVNNAYLFWAPKFFAEKFSVSVAQAGSSAMTAHHITALAAILCGGYVTDMLVKKMPRARLFSQVISLLLGVPAIFMIGQAPTLFSAVVMTAFYGLTRGFFEVNTHATVFDFVEAKYRSSTVGFMLFIAFLVGGLSGILFAELSEKYALKGYEIGFAILSGAYLIAASLMSLLLHDKKMIKTV